MSGPPPPQGYNPQQQQWLQQQAMQQQRASQLQLQQQMQNMTPQQRQAYIQQQQQRQQQMYLQQQQQQQMLLMQQQQRQASQQRISQTSSNNSSNDNGNNNGNSNGPQIQLNKVNSNPNINNFKPINNPYAKDVSHIYKNNDNNGNNNNIAPMKSPFGKKNLSNTPIGAVNNGNNNNNSNTGKSLSAPSKFPSKEDRRKTEMYDPNSSSGPPPPPSASNNIAKVPNISPKNVLKLKQQQTTTSPSPPGPPISPNNSQRQSNVINNNNNNNNNQQPPPPNSNNMNSQQQQQHQQFLNQQRMQALRAKGVSPLTAQQKFQQQAQQQQMQQQQMQNMNPQQRQMMMMYAYNNNLYSNYWNRMRQQMNQGQQQQNMSQQQKLQQEIIQLRNMVEKQKLTIDSMRSKQKVLKMQNNELSSIRMENIELKKSLMVLQNKSQMGSMFSIIQPKSEQKEKEIKIVAPKKGGNKKMDRRKSKQQMRKEAKDKGLDPKAALLAHFKKKQGKTDEDDDKKNDDTGVEKSVKGDPKASLLAHFKKKQGGGGGDSGVEKSVKGDPKASLLAHFKKKQGGGKTTGVEKKVKGDPKAALLAHFKKKQGKTDEKEDDIKTTKLEQAKSQEKEAKDINMSLAAYVDLKDSKYVKYFTMKKIGMPLVSVLNKMRLDGCAQYEIDAFEGKKIGEQEEKKKSHEEIALEYGLNPKPKLKPKKVQQLKRFHWEIINPDKIENTIWYQINQKYAEINLGSKFELDFQMRQRKPRINKSGKDKNNDNRKLLNKMKESKGGILKWIPPKRDQAIQIGISRLGVTIEELYDIFTEMDPENKISPDTLSTLLDLVPSIEEQQHAEYKIDEIQGDIEDYTLGKSENFFIELSTIPEIQLQLKKWYFTLVFNEQFDVKNKQVILMQQALRAIKNSPSFQIYLRIILSFGNLMNAGIGNDKEQVFGFDLESLKLLKTVKDFSGTKTLCMHLYKFASQNFKNADDIFEELSCVQKAARLECNAIESSIIEMYNEFMDISKVCRRFEVDYHPADTEAFRTFMDNFRDKNEAQIMNLKVKFENIKLMTKDCCEFYKYKLKDKKIESIFIIINEFLQDLIDSKNELIKIDIERQKQMEKRKKEREKQRKKQEKNGSIKNSKQKMSVAERLKAKEKAKNDAIDNPKNILNDIKSVDKNSLKQTKNKSQKNKLKPKPKQINNTSQQQQQQQQQQYNNQPPPPSIPQQQQQQQQPPPPGPPPEEQNKAAAFDMLSKLQALGNGKSDLSSFGF